MSPFFDDPHLVEPTLLHDPEPRPVDDDRRCDTCSHPRWMHNGRCHFATWKQKHDSRRGEVQCKCREFVRVT